jgi:hypothetical protein
MRNHWHRLLALALVAAPVPALAQEALTVAEARASMLGRWQGKVELLDEGTNESFDWPVAVTIEDAGDGNTQLERQQFEGMSEDGALHVSVSLLDPDGVTEYRSLYVRGSLPEHRTVTLSLTAAEDAAHWTLYGSEDYERDGELLQARFLVVRDGDTVVSTFEVDPAGDEPPFAQTRRTLRRVAAAP